MGTKLKYTLTNYSATGTIAIGGNWAEDSDYPKENCFNERVSKRMGFDTDSDGTIVIDIGSAVSLDCLALMNHNLTSSATVTFQMNSADSWGAPPVSESVTYRAGDMHIQLSSPETYRYVRIVIDDSTRGTDDIKIGELIVGLLTELDRNFDWNLKTKKLYKNLVHETVGGNKWINVQYKRNIFTMTFSMLDVTQYGEVFTMIDGADGNATPFLMLIDDTPYYVRLPEEMNVERPIPQPDLESLGPTFFPVDYKINDMQITEESRGI